MDEGRSVRPAGEAAGEQQEEARRATEVDDRSDEARREADGGRRPQEERRWEQTAERPQEAQRSGPAAPAVAERPTFDLFGDKQLAALRDRWTSLQVGFVDDPAGSARQAEELLSRIMGHLEARHRELRAEGEQQTDGQSDTEANRVRLLRYRTFFQVLLG
jgi:hypothetical protein